MSSNFPEECSYCKQYDAPCMNWCPYKEKPMNQTKPSVTNPPNEKLRLLQMYERSLRAWKLKTIGAKP